MTSMIDHLAGQSFTFPKYPPSGVREQWSSYVQIMVSELVLKGLEEFFISTNSSFQEWVFQKDAECQIWRACVGRGGGEQIRSLTGWAKLTQTQATFIIHLSRNLAQNGITQQQPCWNYNMHPQTRTFFAKLFPILVPFNEWPSMIAISYSVFAFHSTQHRLVHDKNFPVCGILGEETQLGKSSLMRECLWAISNVVLRDHDSSKAWILS